MKRSTDSRRSPAEIGIDLQRHYGRMAECAPDQKARDWFKRPAGVQVMIRAQAEQIRDTNKYVAEKYGIRGDADGQEHTE